MEFEVEGDLSLYPLGTDRAIVLNRTASAIWRRLAEPVDLVQLVSTLADEHGEAPEAIRADIEATVHHLVDLGLVVAEPPLAQRSA